MSKQDVFEFLRDNPDEWFTCREIAEGTGLNVQRIGQNLKRLRRSDELKFKQEKHKCGSALKKIFVYKYESGNNR